MGKMVTITLDGKQIEVDVETFRKVVVFAQANLISTKKADGKLFPASEKAALDLTFKLQTTWIELI